jgi:hypothetical protein
MSHRCRSTCQQGMRRCPVGDPESTLGLPDGGLLRALWLRLDFRTVVLFAVGIDEERLDEASLASYARLVNSTIRSSFLAISHQRRRSGRRTGGPMCHPPGRNRRLCSLDPCSCTEAPGHRAERARAAPGQDPRAGWAGFRTAMDLRADCHLGPGLQTAPVRGHRAGFVRRLDDVLPRSVRPLAALETRAPPARALATGEPVVRPQWALAPVRSRSDSPEP